MSSLESALVVTMAVIALRMVKAAMPVGPLTGVTGRVVETVRKVRVISSGKVSGNTPGSVLGTEKSTERARVVAQMMISINASVVVTIILIARRSNEITEKAACRRCAL